MSTRESVIKQMTIISANYPNYKLTEQAVMLYVKVLADVPDDALEASALDICSRPGAFFPTAGDWRAKAMDLLLAISGVPLPIEAWEEAVKVIYRCGDYWRYPIGNRREPEYSHPLIERTVEAIGYRNILESTNTEVLRAQFLKAYEALRDRQESELRMLPAVKQVEQKYIASGIMQLAEGMSK